MAHRYVHAITPSPDREPDDFYPTPPEGTRALLALERFDPITPGHFVWEPACGDGAMSRELMRAGYPVLSTDLIDRGFGTAGIDFLAHEASEVDHVVTNPPFKLAEEFAAHALAVVPGKVALLCRLAWLEGSRRRCLFESTNLSRVLVFSRRLKMQRGRQATDQDGAGMVAFAWYIWDRVSTGEPRITFIP